MSHFTTVMIRFSGLMLTQLLLTFFALPSLYGLPTFRNQCVNRCEVCHVKWNWPFSAASPKRGLADPRAPIPPPVPYRRPRNHSYSSPRCPSSWSPHWPSIRCSFEPMTASSRVLVRTAHCNRQPAARPLREHWRTSATSGKKWNFHFAFRLTFSAHLSNSPGRRQVGYSLNLRIMTRLEPSASETWAISRT